MATVVPTWCPLHPDVALVEGRCPDCQPTRPPGVLINGTWVTGEVLRDLLDDDELPPPRRRRLPSVPFGQRGAAAALKGWAAALVVTLMITTWIMLIVVLAVLVAVLVVPIGLGVLVTYWWRHRHGR